MKKGNSEQAKLDRKKMLNNEQILNQEQKVQIKDAFDLFDITGSGRGV